MSVSHRMIESKPRGLLILAGETEEYHTYTILWTPWASGPNMLGWERTSGVRKLREGISPVPAGGFEISYRANGEELSVRELVATLDKGVSIVASNAFSKSHAT